MSATIVREKRQTTLPQDVADAAGIKPGDQVDWTFADGEIRGRKLVPALKGTPLKLVKKSGFLMLEGKLDRDDILAAIRADRKGK
ncbi:MAG TPA: AbrB/MazE/SpoVT family DNA-binding domain-containing protein [Verrucomicrobiae bacterium]|nr:AbrB/MazE/SpoVT family DNA-binding domain-containing protein [Verrucomicrobiae bacterium]